jgi:hypothetical protein
MKEIHRKILVASFFVALMLIVPFTSITKSSDNLTSSKIDQQISSTKALLTAAQMKELQDLTNSIKDKELRSVAQNIVNRLVSNNGEVDLNTLAEFIGYDQSGQLIAKSTGSYFVIYNYENPVLGGRIISRIIDMIISWVWGKILEWMGTRLGWLVCPIVYYQNVSIIIAKIEGIYGAINQDINTIKELKRAIGRFLSAPGIITRAIYFYQLIIATGKAYQAAISLMENISNLPDNIRTYVTELYVNTTTFYLWLQPENGDYPYERPIAINVNLVGIDPSSAQVYCDGTYYTPDESTFQITYDTANKENAWWIHECTLTAYAGDGRRISVGGPSTYALSMGVFDVTFDFTNGQGYSQPSSQSSPTPSQTLQTQLSQAQQQSQSSSPQSQGSSSSPQNI